MNEKLIIQHLKSGSKEALRIVWEEHSTHILNLSFRMLKNRDDAEDVLMDIFATMPKTIKNFRGMSSLGTWLYKLTINECLMKLRKEKKHKSLEYMHLEQIKEQNHQQESSKKNFDEKLLLEGLNKLPADTRGMLWLKDAENLDIKDLSEIYRMPEGTIKARLSRARHLVKNFLKGE